MISFTKLKSFDFYRWINGDRVSGFDGKIPRDLTEATLSGVGLSILAALSMMLLFGMELSNYLSVSVSTSVIVDNSSDGDFLRIDFNISFPALSCEFATVDVNDVIGTNRLNITKTIRKFSIDSNLQTTGTGAEFHSEPLSNLIKHGDETVGEIKDDSFELNSHNFDRFVKLHPILVVNFYAPWCYWSNRLRPSWEKAAKIIKQRYDPKLDGRIIMGKVDCTDQSDLCRTHHVQGYPSIRIFRRGSDLRLDHGHHDHEAYHGDRDTESLVKTMEELVKPLPMDSQNLAKMPAPSAGGCRIEGYVRVKKVPGSLVIAARSDSHSFDASRMNMSHVISHLSFGRKISTKVFSDVKQLSPYIGTSYDRLNGLSFINHDEFGANVTVEHYLQIVKTEVLSSSSGKLLEEYEYTAHSSVAQSLHIPVAKFHFQLSPMQVVISENPKSFSHFITTVCAIIGGVFTVAGILDAVLHNAIRFMKKVELGKNF